ncbi:MAG: hypothetical protein LBC03_05705 [Nitrososphaerota archaeon]|jgi:hypothetical protein|nr:hypothetical protein [Nitrososphaerota archaeon]
MKKQLIKTFTPLLIILIATSLMVFPTNVSGQNSIQNETMDFMKNVITVDVSKYAITIARDFTLDDPLLSAANRKISHIDYALNSENSNTEIQFTIERGAITACDISPPSTQIISSSKQPNNQLDAVKGFLERYQTYTKNNLSNLIAMLKDIDTSKDSTIITGNTKLTIQNSYSWETDQTLFSWSQVINGAEYPAISLVFSKEGNFIMMRDAQAIYTIGDTSVNISKEQAIDIALENLQFYSYEMPDGSVVKDFKLSRAGVAAELEVGVVDYVDYELRPYWKIEMYLDEVAPGNVHGIQVFVWANTGKVISYSNIAFGGTVYTDDTNLVDTTTTSTPNSNMLIVGVAIVTAIAVAATGIIAIKKRSK